MTILQLAEHHKFAYRDSLYLYHVGNMRVYRINPALSTEIDRLQAELGFADEELAPEVRAVLSTLGLLEEERVMPCVADYIPKRQPVLNLTLNVAQLCNLSCIYCYGGDGEYGEKGYMPEEIAFRSIDWLIEQSLDARDLSITFFGGEPLLNFPLIQNSVSYAMETAERAGKTMVFSITTNGTLLNDEINQFLNDHNFSVTISFDGDPEMQNTNRPMKGGKGSFDVAKPRIERFLQSRDGRASGRATVTGQNADLQKIRQQLTEIGFRTVGTAVASLPSAGGPVPVENEVGGKKTLRLPVLQPAKSNGRTGSHLEHNQAAARLSDEQHQRLLADLAQQAEEALEAIKARRPLRDARLLLILRQLRNKNKRLYFCGVGRSLLAVSISGDVYPCHRFVGQESMKMGNISNWDPEAMRPYLENVGMGHRKCSQCWARSFCGGGCIHDSINSSGSMDEPNPLWCSELRRTAELAITVYDRLDEADKQFLRL